MRRTTLLACLGLLLAAGFLSGQPEPDRDLLASDLKSLTAKNKETRLAAIKKIGEHGLAARAAAAELGKRMCEDPDPQVAGQAARALAQIGPAGVPALIEGARHPKAAVRNRALWALGLMGPDAKEAVYVLTDALEDQAPELRVLAAAALGEMEAAAKYAIPALCEALRDKDAKVRMQAALALRNIGADAVPALQELLKDEDTKVRQEALQAVMYIGADAKAAVGDITELLTDDSAALRMAAADALWGIGPDAKKAIPNLLTSLRDKKGPVQQHGFQALLRIGSADVPEFLATLRKLNSEVHWAFPYLLRQFGPKAKDAVRPLIKELEAADPGHRMSAALALGEIGKDAREAIPALQKVIKGDPEPLVRHSAIFALNRISAEPAANAAVQLQAALNHIEIKMQQLAARMQAVPQWRPLNRQAMFDPIIQQQYDQVVNMNLMLSAMQQGCGDGANARKAGPVVQALGMQASNLVQQMEPEAAPALIRGLHLAAYYELGFC